MDLSSRAGGGRGVDVFYAIAAAVLNAASFGAGLQIDFGSPVPSFADFTRRTLASLRAGSHISFGWDRLRPLVTATTREKAHNGAVYRAALQHFISAHIQTFYPSFF